MDVRRAHGFTLVELMISLVLGLIISAAVIQVYLINVKTSATQKSGSELQNSSVFGLEQLERKLRIANLGNPVTTINDVTPLGGIVLSNKNLGLPDDDTTYLSYLTHSAGDTGFNSVSNVNEANGDQLTIQYINISSQPIYDCESEEVEPLSPTSDPQNTHAVERYFLRNSSNSGEGMILVCDAGRIYDATETNPDTGVKTTTRTIKDWSNNYTTGGSEFVAGVDQFKVLLGTQTTSDSPELQYLSPSQYMALSQPRPAITHVKFGVIARGATPVLDNEVQTTFKLLNNTYTLKNSAKKIRQSYESNTLLRNARVITVK